MSSKPRRRLSGSRRQESWAGWLLAGPWIVSLFILTIVPLLATAYFSLTNLGVANWPDFIGLRHYNTILTADSAFWRSLDNTARYTLISVPLRLLLAFALALLLNSRIRGLQIYQTLYYLPAMVPPVAAAVIFMLLLTPGAGPVNVILETVGLSPPDWTRDPNWAIWTLILLSIWPLGIETLVFLAALRGVPSEVLDAARLDAARHWERLWFVTIPIITPAILFNLVIGMIASFQVFSQAMVIGGTTGRPGESTLMLLVVIYRTAFRYFNMGYAAALSIILFVILAALTALIFLTARRWVHYEGGSR